MQRIVIKNFGAVKEADIELKKITVLIGEQASGKSTIAKLVYFFKTLKNDFFREVYSNNLEKEEETINFNLFCQEKFYNLFGSTINLTKFEICCFFTNEKYILINLKKFKRLNIFFSEEMKISELVEYSTNTIKQLRNNKNIETKSFKEKILIEQKIKYSINQLSNLLDKTFESNQNDFLYVIAGRSATVSYSDLFEKYLFADLQNKLLENNKLSLTKKRHNVDEALMLKFMERISTIKSVLANYNNFENLIKYYSKDKMDLTVILDKISKIIKGKYVLDEQGERIIYNNDKKRFNYISLSNASSGQQEVIRILQDILISVITESIVFRILEEPEAHLFPSAQKELIELLSFLINQNEDNQIIITTHSPYILTVFNNLIFSKRITDKNPDANNEVNEIIGNQFWIDSDDFSAYNLGKTDDNERHAQSIINEKTGLIQQNYLDEVSEKLGNDFQKLYSIHQKSFSRK